MKQTLEDMAVYNIYTLHTGYIKHTLEDLIVYNIHTYTLVYIGRYGILQYTNL